MIRFLFKGLLRDRNRSLLPALVVTIGVMLTVFLHCYITGVIGDMVDTNARFTSGHIKVLTKAYAENMDQSPIDLALEGVSELTEKLKKEFPTVTWVPRIHFGGLLDVPDINGETMKQGVTMGFAADIFSENSTEIERLNINKGLVRGSLPKLPGEILISDDFATKMNVNPGDVVTLLSSTMYGSMSVYNFTVTGTIKFGVGLMDKGTILVDISDARLALDMFDAASEILGYFGNSPYDDLLAEDAVNRFKTAFPEIEDEFSPTMLRLKEQGFFSSYLDMVEYFVAIVVSVFVVIMSIVLWNTGLIGGLRRYGEVGVRLAIGENKGHVYRSMISESILVGFVGSVFGTIIGLLLSYWLQTKGIDVGSLMKDTTMMMQSVFYAKITPTAWYIGFFPGLFSIVLGTMLSGIGIYKRQTAQLFKELEV